MPPTLSPDADEQDCQPRPDFPPENPNDPYTQFLSQMRKWSEQRGRGGTKAIDEAPDWVGDLAAYFASLPIEKLAACWVACITDTINHDQLGAVARAMIVVAERLHNVQFTTPSVPAPRQAIDKEHPVPFKIEITTPPVDIKTAKKTPPYIRDASETIRTAPMTWRWFVWENCPKAWKKPAKALMALHTQVDVYLNETEQVVVSNAGSGPRIGAASNPPPASNGVHKPNNYDAKVPNEVGRRAEGQAPKVLAILAEKGVPMTVGEIRDAMGLTMSPNGAIGLLATRMLVATTDLPNGKTQVELTEAGRAEAAK